MSMLRNTARVSPGSKSRDVAECVTLAGTGAESIGSLHTVRLGSDAGLLLAALASCVVSLGSQGLKI